MEEGYILGIPIPQLLQNIEWPPTYDQNLPSLSKSIYTSLTNLNAPVNEFDEKHTSKYVDQIVGYLKLHGLSVPDALAYFKTCSETTLKVT